MRNLLLGTLLAATATACQHSGPATSARPAPAALANTPDSTAAVLALLRQVNLAPAWNGSAGFAMEGFYGPDNYRISFHLDSVRRDAQRPNVFHFQGRDRYKKIVTPFTGTLTVTRLAALPDTAGLLHSSTTRAYSAFASFGLREDPAAKGAGHCTGRAVLDFVVDRHQQASQTVYTGIGLGEANPTKGCGQLFRGVWQSNRTGQRQPVAWANSYGVLVPNALRKLGLGERMDEVNPKLARYGWNTIMENDEWWAKSPQPSASL